VSSVPDQYDSHGFDSPGYFADVANGYRLEEEISHHDSPLDDFLTAECSSENPVSEHTTPQEIIWEQQFISPDTAQLHIMDNFVSHSYGSSQEGDGVSDLQSILQVTEQQLPKFVSGNQLLHASATTAPNPSRHLSSEAPTQRPSSSLPSTSTLTDALRSSRETEQMLRVETSAQPPSSAHQRHGSLQATSPVGRAVSPVVMVSNYDIGDGGDVLSNRSLMRTPSKRSHGDDGDSDSDDGSYPPRGNVPGGETALERLGVNPDQRGDDHVPSANELAEQRKIDQRNAEVRTWLATSETGSNADDGSGPRRLRPRRDRVRAHSTGTRVDALGLPAYSDKNIPGPGVLIDEDSDDDYSADDDDDDNDDDNNDNDDDPESPSQVIASYRASQSPRVLVQDSDTQESEQSHLPPVEDDVPAELQEPLPRQFYRRTPWQDPVRVAGAVDSKDQPPTSSAAASRFNQEAAKWETASRAATWGTRRRLSESEVNSIVEGSQVRHLSLSKRGRERGSSLLHKARGFLPRRSSSNIHKVPEGAGQEPTGETPGHAHHESLGSPQTLQRIPSLSKPKSPPLNTGSALMAMTGQLVAIGRGNAMAPEADGAKSPLQALRKQRSKSDVGKSSKSSSTPGLAELMTRHGGPPMPTLASPMQEREPATVVASDLEDAAGDDDDDDMTDEVAIKMDLDIRADNIIPSLEGFKDHARQLNPRLEEFLIDRIGQEQLRRYKKLVENKVKHTRGVRLHHRCPSGKHCFDLGGQATLLAPRVSAKDPDTTCVQFQVSNPADHDLDDASFGEVVVTPASFPQGIPEPPVKRLPAEFECPLCFKVKKFQKPSDWTKHVHEDVLPFSCTSPTCPEPKSFKRKADWVRHENERHRHLEWWKCNIQGCNHMCYRKDNFVQHLVREHKKVEPKLKGRGSGSSKARPANGNGGPVNPREQEDNEVWRLVEECRHETANRPRDEPCRFCGNICSTWKKLSVHMGKHMEQIAMPVLTLVSMRQVSPDTIVSPIEQQQPALQQTVFGAAPSSMNTMDASGNLSPYTMSATSAYQTSSAGHSPVSMHGRLQTGPLHFDGSFYGTHNMSRGMPPQVVSGVGAGASFARTVAALTAPAYGFGRNGGPLAESFMSSPSSGHFDPVAFGSTTPMVPPRSQPFVGLRNASFMDSTAGVYAPQTPHQPAVYTSAGEAAPYMSPYGSPMLPGHPMEHSHSHSPVALSGRSGLALQAPGQEYLYGLPATDHAGPGPATGPAFQYP